MDRERFGRDVAVQTVAGVIAGIVTLILGSIGAQVLAFANSVSNFWLPVAAVTLQLLITVPVWLLSFDLFMYFDGRWPKSWRGTLAVVLVVAVELVYAVAVTNLVSWLLEPY